MALQVWLPLNGNLNNQGLAGSVTVTNHGATVNSSGKIGSCYSFTTSQYMELNNVPFSSLNTASVCFWVKIAAGDGDWLPFTGQSTSYYILATSGGTGNFYHQNAGSGTIFCDGVLRSSPINDGKWHHYCITNVNLSTWTKFYINYYGSTESGWNFNGQMNDIRIYDHCLSPKEVHEISKALVLHYSLDDAYVEPYNNISNGVLSGSFYNGATGTYGYSESNGVLKTSYFDDQLSSTVIKVYTVNEKSIYPYVFFDYMTPGSTAGLTRTLSFDIYPHGSTRNASVYFYSYYSTPCNYKLTNTTTGQTYTGSATTSTSALSLNKDVWNHVVITLTTTADNNGAGWGYTPLNGGSWTADGNEYWLFKNIQITQTDHELPPISAGSSNSQSIMYDNSGYQYDGVITGNLQIKEDSGRYLRSSKFSSYTNYITSPVPKITSCTISWWFKPDSISNNLIAVGQDGSYYVAAMNGSSFYNNNAGVSSNLYIDGEKKNVSSTSGNVIYFSAKLLEGWHHYCLTNIDISTWTTFKIGNYGFSWPINGLLSDFRIYATVLSADDVKSLYSTIASIDSSANMYTYEYNEVSSTTPKVHRTGVTDSSTIIEPDTITNASFSKTGIIKSRQFYEV